jgi:class 3 adenylate cyclase/tetratricopeptide (TPR) repeat protein
MGQTMPASSATPVVAEDADRLAPYLSRLHAHWLGDCPTVGCRSFDGTLVFADVSGFTPLTERLSRQGKIGAEHLTDILNDVFGRLLLEAERYGGDLLKFGGDALFLLFDGDDHPQRAAAAAVAIQRALRPFRRMHHEAGLVSLRMSIGMATGPVDAFLVGDSHREMLVAGPTCTRTLEMETAAEAGEILMHADLAARLDRRFVGEARGDGYLLLAAPPAEAVLDLRAARGEATSGVPISLRAYLRARRLAGEHRPATVAFLHVGGIDRMLADDGAEAVAGALDDLVGRVQQACADHEVTFLATDVGPGAAKILLASGAISVAGADEDRMLHALRAVFDATSALPIRVGLSFGRVFAVDVGSATRRTFAVMGDPVNLAARVMGKAEPGWVLATDALLERVGDDFELTAVEPFRVKGKSEPVHAHLVGRARGRRRAQGAILTELMGRSEELAALRAAVQGAREGRGRVVELVGEPGIGKSRLMSEFRAAGEDLALISIEGGQFAASTPYYALRNGLRQFIGAPRDDNDEARDRLLAVMAEQAPDLMGWAPLLAPVFGVDLAETAQTTALDPAFRRTRLHAVAAEFVTRLIVGPTLVAIEDAHWLDDASRELLGHLLAGVGEGQVSVCVTRRPVGAPLPFTTAGHLSTFHLSPLSREAAIALLSAASDDAPLSPHALRSLAERGAGNPLFLQQLLAAARAGSSIADLPDTVEEIIAERIDKLVHHDRSVLRVASVLGARFSARLLDEMLREDDATTGSLDALSGFLTLDDDDMYRFDHALVREAAYEGLAYRRREQLHGRAGELLERLARHPEDAAEQLSHHYSVARQYDKAWRFSVVAAERAKHNAAPVEAAAFFGRALEAASRLTHVSDVEVAEVWTQLGDVLELSGQYERAAGAYRQARLHCRSDVAATVELYRKEGRLRERSRRYSSALRWYTKGFQLLDKGGIDRQQRRRARGRLLATYGAARLRQGRLRESLSHLEEAVQLAKRSGDRSTLAHAYYLLDWAHTELGNEERFFYRPLALPIYEELGDVAGQANVLNNLSIHARWDGDWVQAAEYARRFREACERAGDMVQVGTAANNYGELLFEQGHLDEAEQLFREASQMWRAFAFPVGIALANSNVGRVAAFQGTAEAEERLALARGQFVTIGAENFVVEVDGREAERLLLGGDAPAALGLLERTHKRASELGAMPLVLAWLERLWGCALAQVGQTDPAADRLARSLARGQAVSGDFEIAMTLDAQSRLLGLSGDGQASACADRAVAIFGRLGVIRPPSVPVRSPTSLEEPVLT